MSRKRFATMIAVVLLLGAAGLLSLYVTLGKMNEALRAQGRGGTATAEAPVGAEKIEQMTLTPAGEQQLREEQLKVQQSQALDRAAAAPPPAAPSKPPASPPPG
jgi:Sec-independent protein translocase protein TatA